METKLNTPRTRRHGVRAVVAGATVASMLATGAVAQARLPTPESGNVGSGQAAAVAVVGSEGAAEHVATMRGFARVQPRPAPGGGVSTAVVVITLAGLGGIALAIPAARVYRRRSPDVVANA